MKRFKLTVLFALISALITIACNDAGKSTNVVTNAPAKTSNASPIPSATIDELASGRKVYQANCAKCHKDDGTGGEVVIEGKKLKADDLTSAKLKGFPDDKITRIIMNGAEDDGMPAFKGKLSEGEMRDVVTFIRTELQKMPQGASNTASPKS